MTEQTEQEKQEEKFKEVQRLYDLAKECAKLKPSADSDTCFEEWISEIEKARTENLVALIGKLTSNEEIGTRKLKAYREAVISETEYQNAREIVKTMKDLDSAATRLTWVSICLTVLALIFTVVQVIPLINQFIN